MGSDPRAKSTPFFTAGEANAMRDFWKGFFHGLKLGFKAWFIGISSVSAIICICQVLG